MSEQAEIILEKHEKDYDLSVSLADEEAICLMSLIPKRAGVALPSSTLDGLLKDAGIVIGIDNKALEEISRAAMLGKAVARRVVARGRRPDPGQPGSVEWFAKPTSDHPVFQEKGGTGQVDYHETHLFENIREGQVIAMLHPPQPGADGVTVRGEKIIPEIVKSADVRAGPGVILQDGRFLASKQGRIVFKDNVISISDELIIKGSVDFSVGHIDFIGHVHIHGDVMDEFNVCARQGLVIDGIVGSCRIESCGNIQLRGMNGHGLQAAPPGECEHETMKVAPNASIKCGGDLRAGYLHCVSIECDGDINVQRELMHCCVKSAGAVVSAGTIAGGECTALAGIESGNIGTVAGVKTLLEAGVDFRKEARLTDLARSLADVEAERGKLKENIAPYARHGAAGLLPDVAARLGEMLARLQELDSLAKSLAHELEAAASETSGKANPKINAHKAIYPGVFVKLGHVWREVKELHHGAHSIIELAGAELRFPGFTTLSRKSSEIERELLAREEAEIMKLAHRYGVVPGDMSRVEFIRAIQKAEGFEPCFATRGEECRELKCLFRRECMKQGQIETVDSS